MSDFLASNDWQWRLARTIVQGVIGVLIANIDLIVGWCVFDPIVKRALAMALGSRYDEVQAEVNWILSGGSSASYDVDALARRVIAGEFGNGDERKRRLGSYYSIVQARVNEMLS